jgi:hypothetical protein
MVSLEQIRSLLQPMPALELPLVSLLPFDEPQRMLESAGKSFRAQRTPT